MLTIMVISLRSVIMFVRSAQLEVFNVCVDKFLDYCNVDGGAKRKRS